MKKKRSLCAALLAGLMVTAVCLTGCGQKAAGNGSSGVDSDKVYQVGVCQLTQHDALDAATQGFVDALNTILGSEHVNIDVQVASGDSTTCTPHRQLLRQQEGRPHHGQRHPGPAGGL